jgi:integrase
VAQVKVRLKQVRDSIQLVFSHLGKRHYLSIGLRWNKVNCEYAKLTAARIERDIMLDRFIDLATNPNYYKVGGDQQPPIETARTSAAVADLAELWGDFVAHKLPKLSQSTRYVFRGMTSAIEQLPCGLEDPARLRDWIEAHHAPQSGLRLWRYLKACCAWAVERGKLPTNPLERLKFGHGRAKPKEIDPFAAGERDRLLEVIRVGQHSAYYHRLISFLFFTGCRPSEAIALEWSHIAADGRSLTFCQSATRNEQGQIRIKQSLKSQRQRRIPINERVRKIIGESDGESLLVFPALGGGVVNTKNLASRIWYPALEVAGLPRRNLYQCRHTFATLAVQGGLSIPDVAKLLGNSPQVTLKHYAGASRDLALPSL